jgi:hypothetical protein
MARDNFTASTVRNVALRAGHICSNPDCRHPTAGPHSEPNRAVITGEAAHICAASVGGPRYDEQQTVEDRRDISNAIWLCGNCNKKIDSDWNGWSRQSLVQMKNAHESWVAARGMIPTTPVITLYTQPALRMSQFLPEVTSQLQDALRDQELKIENPNRVYLHNIKLNLSLPEVSARGGDYRMPVGTEIEIEPIYPSMQAQVTGQACAAKHHSKIPTTQHRLQINKLAPGAVFSTGVYTARPEQTMPYDWTRINPDGGCDDPEKMDEHKVCFFYLEGTYQFQLRDEYVTAEFFVPLHFEAATRTITSRPVQTSSAPWTIPSTQLGGGATLKVGTGGSMEVAWVNFIRY